MQFNGIARDEGLIPGVKPIGGQLARAARQYGSWDALLAGWKRELEALGRGFASGDARVDPKQKLKTCRCCDVQPFCRIYERLNSPFALDEEAAGAGGDNDGTSV